MNELQGIKFYEDDLYLCDEINGIQIYACMGYQGANEYRIEVYIDGDQYRLYQAQLTYSIKTKQIMLS